MLKKRDRFNYSSVQYIAERFHPGLHVDEGDLNAVRLSGTPYMMGYAICMDERPARSEPKSEYRLEGGDG